jgi:hypothetical protein
MCTVFSGSSLGCSVRVALYWAPSFNLGGTLHYYLPIEMAVGVVELLGMVRFAMFVSEVYLIVFRYVPVSSSVLVVGSLCLWYCYWVELLARLVVVPKFCVWLIIVLGVFYACIVVRLGVSIVIVVRLFVGFSDCRAVSSRWPGPCATVCIASLSRTFPLWVIVGGTGAIRFLVSFQKTNVIYLVLYLQVT